MSEPAAISSSDGQNKGLLRNRNFLLLLGGQTISNVGDIIFDTSLTLWIATKVASGKPWAPLAVSGVLVAATIPVLVVGPAAGVFVDRWNKRKTMLLSDVMRAILVALLLPVTGVSSVEVQIVAIYTVVLLAGVGAQFFSPSDVGINAYSYVPKYTVLQVTGGFNIGGGTSTPATFRTTSYQVGDDVSLVQGTHQWSFGANIAHGRSPISHG